MLGVAEELCDVCAWYLKSNFASVMLDVSKWAVAVVVLPVVSSWLLRGEIY
jgi:hypothetical protein